MIHLIKEFVTPINITSHNNHFDNSITYQFDKVAMEVPKELA